MQIGKLILCGLVSSALFGCGGGDGDSTDSSGSSGNIDNTKYSISGDLANSLEGVFVYDQNNQVIGDLNNDGQFTLSKTYAKGDYFKLTVTPKSDSVTCSLSVDEGTILANITDLSIYCTPTSTRLEMVPEIFAILPIDANSLYLSYQIDPSIGQSAEYSIYVAEGESTITDADLYKTVKGGNGEQQITGLTTGTKYQFKVIARNGDKELESQQETFELTPPPKLVETAVDVNSSLLDYDYNEATGSMTIVRPAAATSAYSRVSSKNTDVAQQNLLESAEAKYKKLLDLGSNAFIVTKDGVFEVLEDFQTFNDKISAKVRRIAAEKILEDGTFGFKYRFTPAGMEELSQSGFSPRLSTQASDVESSNSKDHIHLTPEILYDIVYESRMHIVDKTVQSNSFVGVTGDIGLGLTVELGLEDNAKWEPEDITISPLGKKNVVVVIFGIPVLLSFEPKVKVSRMAEAEGSLSASNISTVNVPFDVKVIYDGSSIQSHNDISAPIFQNDFDLVKAQGSAHAEVAVLGGIDIEVYGSVELDTYVGPKGQFDTAGSVFVVSQPNDPNAIETSLDQLDLTTGFTCLVHAGFKWEEGLSKDAEFCDFELLTLRKQPELKAIGDSDFIVGEPFDLLIEVVDGDGGNHVAPTPEFARWSSDSNAVINVDPYNAFRASVTLQEAGEQSLYFFAKGSQINVEKALEIPLQASSSVCPTKQRIWNDITKWPDTELSMTADSKDCFVSFHDHNGGVIEMLYRDSKLSEAKFYWLDPEEDEKKVLREINYYSVVENPPDGRIDYALSKVIRFHDDGRKIEEYSVSPQDYEVYSDRWKTYYDGPYITYHVDKDDIIFEEKNYRTYFVGGRYQSVLVGKYNKYYSTGNIKQKKLYGEPYIYSPSATEESIYPIVIEREDYYQEGDEIWGHSVFTLERRAGGSEQKEYSALTKSLTYVNNNLSQETYYETVYDKEYNNGGYLGRGMPYPTHTTLYDYVTGEVDAFFEYEVFESSSPYGLMGRRAYNENFDNTVLESGFSIRPYMIPRELHFGQVGYNPSYLTSYTIKEHDEHENELKSYVGSYLTHAVDYTGGLAPDGKPYREIRTKLVHSQDYADVITDWLRTDVIAHYSGDTIGDILRNYAGWGVETPGFDYREITSKIDTSTDVDHDGMSDKTLLLETKAYTADGQLKHIYGEIVDSHVYFHGSAITTVNGVDSCAEFNFFKGERTGEWEYNNCFPELKLKYKKSTYSQNRPDGLYVEHFLDNPSTYREEERTYRLGVWHGWSSNKTIKYSENGSWLSTETESGNYENDEKKGLWTTVYKKLGKEDEITERYYD